MPHIVFIEGNIASGKSTLLDNLKNLNNSERFGKVQVIKEPLDKWKNLSDSNGTNILKHFYMNMERFAYSFQSFAFLSRVKLLEQIEGDSDYVFIERSIWSDKEIFAKNCYEQQIMSEIEWVLYNKWFSWMEKTASPPEMSFVYLQTSPIVSKQRMDKRNRQEENSVTLEYLSQIHQKHQEWFNTKELEMSGNKIKVMTVDANSDYTDEKYFTGIVSNLSEFLSLPEAGLASKFHDSLNVGYGAGC